MAKRDKILGIEERTRHRYYDKWGRKEFEVGQTTREWSEDGRDIIETAFEHRETAGGQTVDASSGDHQGRDQLPLQTCDLCEEESHLSLFRRRRIRMTMSQAATMERCYNCRATLCQNHSRTSRFDGRVRCPWCHSGHRLYKRVVEPVLYIK